MGVLESRSLDFENVIITSVNEGVLPLGKSDNSLIPYDVKCELNLPITESAMLCTAITSTTSCNVLKRHFCFTIPR